jgi:hypothetical protein
MGRGYGDGDGDAGAEETSWTAGADAVRRRGGSSPDWVEQGTPRRRCQKMGELGGPSCDKGGAYASAQEEALSETTKKQLI